MVLCRFGGFAFLCLLPCSSVKTQHTISSAMHLCKGYFQKERKVSLYCGKMLCLEKCNTMEYPSYAAGGHRTTRSDVAKHYKSTMDFSLPQAKKKLEDTTSSMKINSKYQKKWIQVQLHTNQLRKLRSESTSLRSRGPCGKKMRQRMFAECSSRMVCYDIGNRKIVATICNKRVLRRFTILHQTTEQASRYRFREGVTTVPARKWTNGTRMRAKDSTENTPEIKAVLRVIHAPLVPREKQFSLSISSVFIEAQKIRKPRIIRIVHPLRGSTLTTQHHTVNPYYHRLKCQWPPS
ncbi:unnamed protein product [Nesidiocoris tenuis]|uniref:Secreted protein n=1 Tax=Nesidiocoris tenuis TaxID=355587 RepID=A0A6H5H392_9HEMI|nr:unnamed protein product [Nesidiocoris tenuis]